MKKFFGMLSFMALMALVISSCTNTSASNEDSEANATAEEITVNQAPDAKAVAVANAEDQLTGYQVGDKATDFSLMGIDDKEHSLSEMADVKGYVVTFCRN